MQQQQGFRIVRGGPRRAGKEEEQIDALVLFKSGLNFAKRHYWLTLVYIFGLVMVQFAQGFAVSEAQHDEFKQILGTIDIQAMDLAKTNAQIAYDEYRASRGWFFTCDEECTRLYSESQSANAVVADHEREFNLALSNARSKVGVFSEFAVEDARESWWSAYEGGISFAKRMSYYDAFSLAIGSMRRDDSLASVVLQFLISAAMNLMVGMVSSFLSFVIHLVQLVLSSGCICGRRFRHVCWFKNVGRED
ncbi:hypothetical protein BASA81_005498 [Batrachochytrium salamandrivorans]|nr:hypothetical protein BASA81_005498 [Batrachochytrium salamandrivorans]